ncbi:hypothetical protein GCM10010335_37670 [Streptomyces galbus]|nr:hypothetical protein GCM10010335_37670 [Streptomyces galbus]
MRVEGDGRLDSRSAPTASPVNGRGGAGVQRGTKPGSIGANAPANWSLAPIHHPWVITRRDPHSYDGPTTPRAAATRQSEAVQMRRDGGGV